MNLFLIAFLFIIMFGIGLVFGGLSIIFHSDTFFNAAAILFKKSKESELIAEVFNASGNGIFLCKTDGKIIVANPSFCSLLGYTKDEILKKTFNELTPDRHTEQDLIFLNKSINDNLNTFEIRKDYIHKNGTNIPVIVQVSTLRRSNGEVTFYTVNVQLDVNTPTNHVINHRYFETAFNYSEVGMALVDIDGQFIRCNSALTNIIGYTQSELIKKSFQEITYKEDLQKDIDLFERMYSGDIETYKIKKRYIHKDGHLVPVSLCVSGVFNEIGKITTFVSQVQIDGGGVLDANYLTFVAGEFDVNNT